MADNSGIYDISGKVETAASQSLALQHEGLSSSLNERRSTQRDYYDRLIVGATTSRPPSWTQAEIGKKHGFVMSELSSSQHEVSSRNARFSASVALENTAVPASASSYYSKQSQLVTLTYKLSASAGLTQTPAVQRSPSTLENLLRSNFNSVSGSYRNNDYWNPATFSIDVPDYGKIRDVKVWVELIHDHRGGQGTGSADTSNTFWAGGSGSAVKDLRHGLQGLQIALRSPNVNFEYSHPLWNDVSLGRIEKRANIAVTSSFGSNAIVGPVPEILKNSYLLWSGHAVEQDLGSVFGSSTSSMPDNEFYFHKVTNYTTSSFTGKISLELANDRVYALAATNNQFMFFSSSLSAPTVWNITSIGDGGAVFQTGQDAMMTIDPNSNIHLAYYQNTTPRTVYYNFIPAGIATSRVTSSFGLNVEAAIIDIKVLSDNTPVVLYANISAGNIYLARSSSLGWMTESISRYPPARLGGLPAEGGILVSDNVINTFYKDRDSSIFYHAVSGTNGWVSTPIMTASIAGALGELRVVQDRNGIPHAIAKEAPFVYLLRSSSLGWSKEVIFSSSLECTVAATQGGTRPIRFDSNNEPRVIFTVRLNDASTSRKTFYATSSSLGWCVRDIASDTAAGSLVIDEFDKTSILVSETTLFASAFNGTGSLLLFKATGSVLSSPYHEYDSDIDMRTVFTDSSRTPNPRDISSLFVQDIGVDGLWTRVLKNGDYPSPTSASLTLFEASSSYFRLSPKLGKFVKGRDNYLTGANFPWMLDPRVPPGNFTSRNFDLTASLPGVPAGWLTGPANSANVNEWPTTGSQIGPSTIRPVYPLLDDVYCENLSRDIGIDASFQRRVPVGFRPGLRGTEVHGRWTLMIGNNADVAAGQMKGSERSGFWFRQFRIEFTIDRGQGITAASHAGHDARFKKKNNSLSPIGNRTVELISGSSNLDSGVNRVFIKNQDEYGRSVGITSNQEVTSFAVYSKITGSLVTLLSGSNRLDGVESTYLSNEFGTPYIPLTSGSGQQPSFDAFTQADANRSRQLLDVIFRKNTLISPDNTLVGHINRAGVTLSTRDIVENITATSSSSIG